MSGTLILSLYSSPFVYDVTSRWYFWYPRLFFRGPAEWIFIIGVYGVTRNSISDYILESSIVLLLESWSPPAPPGCP